MKQTSIFTILLILIAQATLLARWDNNVLRGHIFTRDSVMVEVEGEVTSQATIKPLGRAAVMLFKSKNEAEMVYNKFKGDSRLYEGSKSISVVTRMGTESLDNGRFDVVVPEAEKESYRYLVAGLMGYQFDIYPIDETLPDTLYLAENIFMIDEVDKTGEADDPFKPVYKARVFLFSDLSLKEDNRDLTIFLKDRLGPTDLSINFLSYCWYYTHKAGSAVGSLFTSTKDKDGKPIEDSSENKKESEVPVKSE